MTDSNYAAALWKIQIHTCLVSSALNKFMITYEIRNIQHQRWNIGEHLKSHSKTLRNDDDLKIIIF